MTLPVYVYGSSVLRNESVDIAADHPELEKFIADMFETMYASEGVGLAAPQVGRNIRLFVIDARMYADDDPALEGFKKVFINPKIYEYGDREELMGEGCLSLPGLNEDVYRPDTIRMRYVDENFQPHDEEFTGYAARVIQHEYDHLEGKVFTDHLSPLRRTLLKSKLSAFAKGKFDAKYKTRLVK